MAADPFVSNRIARSFGVCETGPISGTIGGMERVCFLIRVKPEHLDEYKRRHCEVWPEMLQALRDTGWHNYSLFLREDGLMVGYFNLIIVAIIITLVIVGSR